jgi:prolyl-tRNA editing enzyme YbaK/EbsC (Cys-tRNA(Pro) deacylase)
VGGTSPFATRKQLPIFMEKTIAELDTIYINGGKRGFLVSMTPQVVIDLLQPKPV